MTFLEARTSPPTTVMPTKVGTHGKFQPDGICCRFPMRRVFLLLRIVVDPGLRRDDVLWEGIRPESPATNKKTNPAESSDSRGVVVFTFDGSPRLKPGL